MLQRLFETLNHRARGKPPRSQSIVDELSLAGADRGTMEGDYSAWGVASGGQLLAAACGALIRRECYKVGNPDLDLGRFGPGGRADSVWLSAGPGLEHEYGPKPIFRILLAFQVPLPHVLDSDRIKISLPL
jgi:hypothetical protein